MTHAFLFQKGMWVGEGKMAFSTSPEVLHFYTRWRVGEKHENRLRCLQEIELEGRQEVMTSTFYIGDVTDSFFVIDLENPLIGEIQGKGLISKDKIAWEFRGSAQFEGFEVYEIQDNGDYFFHAEYISGEEFRTIVDGRIWPKSEETRL